MLKALQWDVPRGFTLGRLSVEEADGEGAEALARAPGDPRSCRGALLGVSPSADRRCSKLPALRPQLVGKPGPSPACGLPGAQGSDFRIITGSLAFL